MKGLSPNKNLPMPSNPPLALDAARTRRGWAGLVFTLLYPLLADGLKANEPGHWAFQPITNPPPPSIDDDAWAQNDKHGIILF